MIVDSGQQHGRKQQQGIVLVVAPELVAKGCQMLPCSDTTAMTTTKETMGATAEQQQQEKHNPIESWEVARPPWSLSKSSDVAT